jgi:hypothetical protein
MTILLSLGGDLALETRGRLPLFRLRVGRKCKRGGAAWVKTSAARLVHGSSLAEHQEEELQKLPKR